MARIPFMVTYALLAAFAIFHYVTHVEPDMTWQERVPTISFIVVVFVAVAVVLKDSLGARGAAEDAKKSM